MEVKLEKGWLPFYELAETIDSFVANHVGNVPKASPLGTVTPPSYQRSGNGPLREWTHKPATNKSAPQHHSNPEGLQLQYTSVPQNALGSAGM